MDLSTINPKIGAEQGAFLHLEHPTTFELLYTDDKQPIGVGVLGMDSAAFRRKEAEQANERVALIQRRKPLTAERQFREECDLLAAIVTGCYHMTIDGDVVTPANIAEKMREHRWIKEQIDSFVGRRSNFTQPSPKTSASGRDSSPGGTQPPSATAPHAQNYT